MTIPLARNARWLALASLAVAAPLGAAVNSTAVVSALIAPTSFVDPPDSLLHRLISLQAGRVEVWDGSNGLFTLGNPFLDLRNDPAVPVPQRKVEAGGERGLLAMAVHPNYVANGFVYLYYTSRDWDGPGGFELGDIVVERYTRSVGNPKQADPASAQVILAVSHPIANHNGGDLEFGPDGYLYVTLGDGGGGCDSAAGSGQDTAQLLGKMLRLDVDGADAFPGDPRRNYAIPPDNPLVGVAGLDEIWAMGLRNPFRFSFDRDNGDLFIGDVGEDDWEEINRLPNHTVTAGNPVNFGWPCREGLDPAGCPVPPQGCGATFTSPVIQEANAGAGGNWTSIMGGYFYRGSQARADLGDRYLYGDAGNFDIWLATPQAGQWARSEVLTDLGPYGFAEDERGELYILSISTASIRCVHSGGGCPWQTDETLLWDDGFETGETDWSFATP